MSRPGDSKTLVSVLPAEPARTSLPDGLPRISELPTDSGRPRVSFPTLDVLSGAPVAKAAGPAGDTSLLSLLGAGTLGVTAEHEGRYVTQPEGELGRGGIGRVFVALDRHLGRNVAIKELLVANADAPGRLHALARFLREARITGQLDHPNIVPVYELGRRADGTPYYTMRVVRGRTLAQAINDSKTLGARLELIDHVVGLCQAVAYAHSRGVVHRDIKPDNVMIGEFGETVVLDWGIAKTRGAPSDVAGSSPLDPLAIGLTLDGALCGTPSYMSPEQARGKGDEVDERSDVWGLGVVLYTVLSGRMPFAAKTLPALMQVICEEPHAPLCALDPSIPKELAAITERALQKDPTRRYQNGKELLDDLTAYRSGARVAAYGYSSLELIRRFLERHRGAVIASAIGLVVALVLAVTAYVRLAAARDRALAAERNATANEREARRNELSAKQSLSEVLVEKASQAMAETDRARAQVFAAEALKLVERADARGISIAAQSSFRPEPIAALSEAADCNRYALAANAELLACARGGVVTLFDLKRRDPPRQLPPGAEVSALELAANGKTLALARDDGTLSLFGVGEAAPLFEAAPGRVTALALAADGSLLACGAGNGSVVTFETSGTRRTFRHEGAYGVSALAFAPDSRTLLVGGRLGELSALRYAEGSTRLLPPHTGTVRALVFAQHGRFLASAGTDRAIRFTSLGETSATPAPISYDDAITSLAWTADGRLLAHGSRDKTIHVVDLKDPERTAELGFHDDAIQALAFSADGTRLVSVSRDLGAVTWSLGAAGTPYALKERGNVLTFDFVPGTAELIAAGLGADGVGIWNIDTGLTTTRLPAGSERVRALSVSRDATRLLFAGSDRKVMLWDLPARIPLRVFDAPRDEVRAVGFAPDGSALAFAGLDRTLFVADTRRLDALDALANEAPLQALVFASANTIWTGDRDGVLAAWSVSEKRRVARIQAHDDWLLAIALSPDKKRVATASADRHVKVWDTSTHALIADLVGHEGKALSVDFSPDGRFVASGAEDKSVRVWEPEKRRQVASIEAHGGSVRAVRFARDRSLLASSADDGAIRLFDLRALTEPASELAARVRKSHHLVLVGTRAERDRVRGLGALDP